MTRPAEKIVFLGDGERFRSVFFLTVPKTSSARHPTCYRGKKCTDIFHGGRQTQRPKVRKFGNKI